MCSESRYESIELYESALISAVHRFAGSRGRASGAKFLAVRLGICMFCPVLVLFLFNASLQLFKVVRPTCVFGTHIQSEVAYKLSSKKEQNNFINLYHFSIVKLLFYVFNNN